MEPLLGKEKYCVSQSSVRETEISPYCKQKDLIHDQLLAVLLEMVEKYMEALGMLSRNY